MSHAFLGNFPFYLAIRCYLCSNTLGQVWFMNSEYFRILLWKYQIYDKTFFKDALSKWAFTGSKHRMLVSNCKRRERLEYMGFVILTLAFYYSVFKIRSSDLDPKG